MLYEELLYVYFDFLTEHPYTHKIVEQLSPLHPLDLTTKNLTLVLDII